MAFLTPPLLRAARPAARRADHPPPLRCSAPPSATDASLSRRSALAAAARAVASAAAAAVAATAAGPPLPRAAGAAPPPAPPTWSSGTPLATLPGAPPLAYQDLFVPTATGGAGLRRTVASGARVIVHYRVTDAGGAVVADTRATGAPTSVIADADAGGDVGGGGGVGDGGAGGGRVPVAVYRGLVGMRTGGRRLVSGAPAAVWGPRRGGEGAAGRGGDGPLWVDVSVLKVGPAPVPAPMAASPAAVAP